MSHLFRARLSGLATALAIAAGLGACREPREQEAARTPAAGAVSREVRLARGLALASPPAAPADAKARDAAGEALSHFGDLLDAAGDRVLWGGFQPENGYDPKGQALTELSPFVWAKLYLSTFTFTGAYELHEEGPRTILEVAARFRDGLDAGDYPYPFWHSARKWRSYVGTRALILVFERDRLVAAYRRSSAPGRESAAVREEELATARRWDGRWRWTDARGAEQPRVALFSYLLSTDNPSVASLDRAYRSLEEAFRRHHCDGCHAPDNAAGQSPLFLLDFPNQALAARHALVETLRRDTMPPADPRAGGRAGLPDEAERRQLLALAEQFEREADRALAFEQARTAAQGGARGGNPP